MKYLIATILGCLVGYIYGYMKGYVKGYDEVEECYTSFYEILIKKFYDYEEKGTRNVE